MPLWCLLALISRFDPSTATVFLIVSEDVVYRARQSNTKGILKRPLPEWLFGALKETLGPKIVTDPINGRPQA